MLQKIAGNRPRIWNTVPMWKILMKPQFPGFGLPQPWLLWPSGEWDSKWRSRSSLSVTLPFKAIENIFEDYQTLWNESVLLTINQGWGTIFAFTFPAIKIILSWLIERCKSKTSIDNFFQDFQCEIWKPLVKGLPKILIEFLNMADRTISKEWEGHCSWRC